MGMGEPWIIATMAYDVLYREPVYHSHSVGGDVDYVRTGFHDRGWFDEQMWDHHNRREYAFTLSEIVANHNYPRPMIDLWARCEWGGGLRDAIQEREETIGPDHYGNFPKPRWLNQAREEW